MRAAVGDVVRIELDHEVLVASRLILAAGAGNEALLRGLGISGISMQRRPLHQVIVRRAGLPPLFGHCLTGIERAEPRLTITSHADRNRDGRTDHLWYIGGRLATGGAERDTGHSNAKQDANSKPAFPGWTGTARSSRPSA